MKHLDKWNKKRRNIAKIYNKLLNNLLIAKPEEPDYAKHIYHLYIIRCRKRDELQKYLTENKIGTIIHYPIPVHLQEAYKDLGYTKGDFPITEKYAKEILSLPMFPELTEEEIEYISKTIRNFR